ncbi:MAG: hypothetical protein WBV23_14460 [Desulfobaccales bacterium]
MSTLSTESITTITVNYNAGDIPDNDIQQFKAELQELGYTRIRGHIGPAAGIGAELWISIGFIGLAAVKGIIGHLAVKFFNKLGAKILSFMKRPSHSFRPTIAGIIISYDDVDIEIRYVDDNILKNISLIMIDVMNEIDNGRLKECKSDTIIMPMEIRDGKWEPFFIEESPGKYDYPFRFWRVTSRNINGCFGIYDFMSKKILKAGDLTEDTQ